MPKVRNKFELFNLKKIEPNCFFNLGIDDGKLKTSPEEIVEKVFDRADLFTGFIQENYLDFVPDIQSASNCAENLEFASRILSDTVRIKNILLNNYFNYFLKV